MEPLAFVYDRTMDDVMLAIGLNEKIAAVGFDSLTDAERTAWLAGLKGAYNASDLNRVDQNLFTIQSALVARGYPAGEPFYSQLWTRSSIPTRYTMERIRESVKAVRQSIAMPPDTPTTPDELYRMNFAKANNIEEILEAAYEILLKMEHLTIYCGEINCGEDGQL